MTTAIHSDPTANRQPLTANPPQALKGWVNTFYRHHNGKKLGPYFVRRWRVGCKLYREYIKPQDVERVKAACQAHRDEQTSRRDGARRVNNFVSNYDFMAKMIFQWEKDKDSTQAQYAYLLRLQTEGMEITAGHPPAAASLGQLPKSTARDSS